MMLRTKGAATLSIVDSELLPFDDASMDVVLTHHVIEHVDNQRLHLEEIRRVLRADGFAYLATPNRSSPVMEGHVGNERVLRWRDMKPLFVEAGFDVREYGWRVVCEPDTFYAEYRIGRFIPARVARLARALYPSHMFVLTPKGHEDPGVEG